MAVRVPNRCVVGYAPEMDTEILWNEVRRLILDFEGDFDGGSVQS